MNRQWLLLIWLWKWMWKRHSLASILTAVIYSKIYPEFPKLFPTLFSLFILNISLMYQLRLMNLDVMLVNLYLDVKQFKGCDAHLFLPRVPVIAQIKVMMDKG